MGRVGTGYISNKPKGTVKGGGSTRSIGQAYREISASRGGTSTKSVPTTNKELQERVKEQEAARLAAEKAAQEAADLEAQKQAQEEAALKAETTEQKALILTAAQQELEGSPKFEALRSRRLAELKQDTEGATVAAPLAGGNIKVYGQINPFRKSKTGDYIKTSTVPYGQP